MTNRHHANQGARVHTLGDVRTKRFPATGFPGWGDPHAADYLLDTPPYLDGVITAVNSHGSAPYTRYSIRFDDGSHAELNYGEHFVFNAGECPDSKCRLVRGHPGAAAGGHRW